MPIDFTESRTTRDAFVFQTTRARGRRMDSIQALDRMARRLVSRRQAKHMTRDLLLGQTDLLMPIGQREGRSQVLILGGARHAIEVGGIRGEPLAPVTLAEYLRYGTPAVAEMLVGADPEGLSGQEWLYGYRAALNEVLLSQRGKLAAFFEAFHRFAVVVGCDPLPAPILDGAIELPPAAAVIWPMQLSKALGYIRNAQVPVHVRRQAEVGILIACCLPIRIHELWCLRMQDVNLLHLPAVLDINPRLRDGVNKTAASRRQADIDCQPVVGHLADFKELRYLQGATDEHIFFGGSGHLDLRHEEELTTSLMNRALKHGSGRPDASFHDLRHTLISLEGEHLLLEANQ